MTWSAALARHRGGPPGQDSRTPCPRPGADRTDAEPPQSSTRSVMDRRTPSRAGLDPAGVEPGTRIPDVTWIRGAAAPLTGRRR